MLMITDQAAAKIKNLLEADGKNLTEYGLRVGVQGGGCSGFMYLMDFDTAKEGDKVYSNGDAKVFIDEKSLSYVNGSSLDYADTLTRAGFNIVNPNASGSCGCGESFSV